MGVGLPFIVIREFSAEDIVPCDTIMVAAGNVSSLENDKVCKSCPVAISQFRYLGQLQRTARRAGFIFWPLHNTFDASPRPTAYFPH